MKRAILAIATVIAIAGSAIAKEHTDSTVVFTVQPKMSCANCEKKIKTNLRFEKGIKSISTSVPEQAVTIVFDPKKTDIETITKGFAKIGYKAALKTK